MVKSDDIMHQNHNCQSIHSRKDEVQIKSVNRVLHYGDSSIYVDVTLYINTINLRIMKICPKLQ